MRVPRSRGATFLLAVVGVVVLVVAALAQPLDPPDPVTWAWDEPTDGAPVDHYEVEMAVGTGPFILRAIVFTNSYTLIDPEYVNVYKIRVRGIAADGTPGGFSQESEDYWQGLPTPPPPPPPPDD